MTMFPLRLLPGQDVRRDLEAAVAQQGCTAAFVVSGIGSLARAQVRHAGRAEAERLEGDLEILTLAGSIAPGASHLHASLSDAGGQVIGGHLGYGCLVRTTAEVLLALLHDHEFSRETDTTTGYLELSIRPRPTD
jgi:predicted DNA-binding protein with PD1-like motif